jgi:hypothetical protein
MSEKKTLEETEELLDICPCCGKSLKSLPLEKRKEITIRWRCFVEAWKEGQKKSRKKSYPEFFDNS